MFTDSYFSEVFLSLCCHFCERNMIVFDAVLLESSWTSNICFSALSLAHKDFFIFWESFDITASKIIGFNIRLTHKAISLVGDSYNPSQALSSPLPSGKRYQSIRVWSSRLLISFTQQAARRLNSVQFCRIS